jgi:hypothetical protein
MAKEAVSGPLCFIKFFERERYADEFVRGKLYLNTLAYFKRVERETAGRDGRFDSTEALSMWCQPRDVIVQLNAPGIKPVEISRDDLAAPVSVSRTYYDYMHVLCLYAVQIRNFEIVDGKIKGKTEELRRDLTIDPRCIEFGRYAVVLNPVLFRQRLRDVLRSQGHLVKTGFVKYYDDAIFHGSIPESEVPFWKQRRFNFQREYRVCIYPRLAADAPMIIRVGDISSFCKKMRASEIHTLWSLTPAA